MPLSTDTLATEEQNNGSTLTGLREDILSRAEAVRARDTDGEPNDTEKEVHHVDTDGEAENTRVPPRGKIVDGDGTEENTLRNSPDESAPLDVVVANTSGEVNLPNGELRYNVVSRCLSR